MNIAEALLAVDAGTITKKATKDLEIPRLSKLLGEPFVLNLRQLSARRVREIQDGAVRLDANGRPKEVDNYGLQIRLLCDGITNKDFDNRDVLKHYGAKICLKCCLPPAKCRKFTVLFQTFVVMAVKLRKLRQKK